MLPEVYSRGSSYTKKTLHPSSACILKTFKKIISLYSKNQTKLINRMCEGHAEI
jgi:hypothetical protein